MRFSPFRQLVTLCVLTLPCACSVGGSRTETVVLEASYATAREIIDRCGVVDDQAARQVTDYIQGKLLSGFSYNKIARYPFTITLVACPEPLAWSLGSGKIIFSSGLIQRLPNEAELAFVLAHELAHDVLDHQPAIYSEEGLENPALYSRTLELKADRAALGVVTFAGYDPRGSISALRLLSSSAVKDAPIAGHPSTAERIAGLSEMIEESGWEPPGIVNRRPYAVLRAKLSNSR